MLPVTLGRAAASPRALRSVILSVATAATLIAATGCSSSSGRSASAAAGAPTINRAAAASAVSQYGWTPMPGHDPQFACTDDSYSRAVRDGITYGTYSLAPYFDKSPSGAPEGFEWDLLKTTMNYIGVTKINISYANFDTLIPAIKSHRIDMMPAHETPERLKIIGFTGPVYWYGPVIVVPKGNPAHISSYADLAKHGVTVGVVKGSSAQLYMNNIHGSIVAYDNQGSELQSLAAHREAAVLEDAPTVAQFLKDSPGAPVQPLTSIQLDPATLATLGYAYFEWGLSKDACSLNLAVSRALSDLRANGVVDKILARDGLAGLARTNIPGLVG